MKSAVTVSMLPFLSNDMLKPNVVDGNATVNGKKNSRCGLDNL